MNKDKWQTIRSDLSISDTPRSARDRTEGVGDVSAQATLANVLPSLAESG